MVRLEPFKTVYDIFTCLFVLLCFYDTAVFSDEWGDCVIERLDWFQHLLRPLGLVEVGQFEGDNVFLWVSGHGT